VRPRAGETGRTGTRPAFQPTGRDVELPFVAFYRFDDDGKRSSERVVMNLGPLRD
jgi:hypothetical protein